MYYTLTHQKEYRGVGYTDIYSSPVSARNENEDLDGPFATMDDALDFLVDTYGEIIVTDHTGEY